MLIHFFYILCIVILPLCAILALVLVLVIVSNRIWPSAAGGEDHLASRREEVKRWSAKTVEQLVSAAGTRPGALPVLCHLCR